MSLVGPDGKPLSSKDKPEEEERLLPLEDNEIFKATITPPEEDGGKPSITWGINTKFSPSLIFSILQRMGQSVLPAVQKEQVALSAAQEGSIQTAQEIAENVDKDGG